MSRPFYALGALLLAACALVGVRVSSAEFTDGSSTRAEVGAARDWTAPVVAVVDPGPMLYGTVVVGATASDVDTSVFSVRIEVAPVASPTWTTLCTDLTSPYSCSWDSTGVPDGGYRIRAVATDEDGNLGTSDVVTSTVANTTAIELDPVPSPTRAGVTLTARITNSGPFSTQITLQKSPAGLGSWQNLPEAACAGSGATRTCVHDSTANADGTWDWRAVGVVGGTRTFTATRLGVVVDNTAPSVSQSVPTGFLGGTVSWTGTADDALTSVASVTFEYRPAAGAWATCAVDTSAPYSCSLDTTALADGSYDFRAVAQDVVGNAATTAVVTRVVDNAGPSLSLTVPAGPLDGPIPMTATATDAGAGMGGSGGVRFQYRLQGVPLWTDCGTDATSPYACTTPTLLDGTYEFRAIATNANGRTTTSAVETRVVQAVVASVSITAPAAGATIYGTTTVTAAASSNRGVNSVTLQYRTGAGAWTDVCPADTTSPYSCTWNTATLPYGSYELRAVMSHGAGLSLTSASVSVVVPQPRGYDVQGTATPNGQAASGDTLTLTYTDLLNLSTVATGLTTTTNVATTVSFVGGTPDRLTFPAGINLGTVSFAAAQDYVDAGVTVRFNATISAGTTTANGITVTRITVTLGTRIDPLAGLANNNGTGAMSWVPSALAQDTAGNAVSTATVTETGTADRDF